MTRPRNAHGTEKRELLYPWHPWAGYLVHILEVIEKPSGEVFYCSLRSLASNRWLEVSAWIFGRTNHTASRIGAAAWLDLSVLGALAALLQNVAVFFRRLVIKPSKRSIGLSRRESFSVCQWVPNAPGAKKTLLMKAGNLDWARPAPTRIVRSQSTAVEVGQILAAA